MKNKYVVLYEDYLRSLIIEYDEFVNSYGAETLLAKALSYKSPSEILSFLDFKECLISKLDGLNS